MGNGLVSDRFRRFLVGSLAVLAALWAGSAAAQDYDAGKTGPQLFASDCSACHKGPGGLAKGKDKGSLTSFLREHYTSKQESAELLAAYLVGAGPGDTRIKADAPTGPGGPKSKPRKAEREGDKTGPKAEPQPRVTAEPAAQPDTDDTREEAAPKDSPKRNPRAAEREGTRGEKGDKADKGPGDTVLSKLRFYGSAGGEAKDAARSANPVRRLESYANSGSDSVAPTSATAHDDAAPATKRKPAERKKKKEKDKDDTSASATPERTPRPPTRPASQQTIGNN